MTLSHAIAFTIAALALAPAAAAQQPSDLVGNALSFASPDGLARLSQELELTPDQEVHIARLSEAFQREHGAALAQAQPMVAELRALYSGDAEVRPDALVALSQKYSETLAELLPATHALLREVQAVLTPEQGNKFQQIIGPAALLGVGSQSLDPDVP